MACCLLAQSVSSSPGRLPVEAEAVERSLWLACLWRCPVWQRQLVTLEALAEAAAAAYGSDSLEAEADCSDSDQPLSDEVGELIAVAVAVEQLPVRVVAVAAVEAACTSPEPSVAVADEICSQCCPDRYQDHQSYLAFRTNHAAVEKIDCNSDGGVVCVVTSWKKLVMRSKRTIAASNCSQDQSNVPRCYSPVKEHYRCYCCDAEKASAGADDIGVVKTAGRACSLRLLGSRQRAALGQCRNRR